MADEIPMWAKQRACELANAERVTSSSSGPFFPADCMNSPSMHAFARYIAEHEQPPVDPLLEHVQDFADQHGHNLSAMPWLRGTLLAALRRGMELAKERDRG